MTWSKGKHRGGKTTDGSKSKETKEGHAVSYITRMNKCNNPRCKVCKEEGEGTAPTGIKYTALRRVRLRQNTTAR